MNPNEVIDHYRRRYAERKKVIPYRPSVKVADDQRAAIALLAWCDEHMVDPLTLIDVRFEHMWAQRKQVPRFDRLRSDRMAPHARRSEAQRAAAATQSDSFVQAVRDLTRFVPSHEQVRRRYYFQQQLQLCERNPMSGGFDPRSAYCPSCPFAQQCASKLSTQWGFDVAALRGGRLNDVPDAVRKALRGWDGSVSV